MNRRTFSLSRFTTILGLLALAATARAAESWYTTDYAGALEKAAKENKPVVIEFTGTKWCPPCKMMKRDTFDKKDFQEYAKENLVFVKVDVMPDGRSVDPALNEQNSHLLRKYKIQVYPTFVVLNSQGKVLGRELGYIHGGPEGFKAWLKGVL